MVTFGGGAAAVDRGEGGGTGEPGDKPAFITTLTVLPCALVPELVPCRPHAQDVCKQLFDATRAVQTNGFAVLLLKAETATLWKRRERQLEVQVCCKSRFIHRRSFRADGVLMTGSNTPKNSRLRYTISSKGKVRQYYTACAHAHALCRRASSYRIRNN